MIDLERHPGPFRGRGRARADVRAPGPGVQARRLADEQNVLALPGSMFGPGQEEYLRVAFANVAAEAMPALAERLAVDAARG